MGTCEQEVLDGGEERPVYVEFQQHEQDETQAAQEDEVEDGAHSTGGEEVEVDLLVVEAHQEQSEQHHKDHADEAGEESRRVDSLGGCFGHDDAGNGIVQLIGGRMLQRMPESDLAVGDVPPYMGAETVVADDDLQFIIA